MLGPSKGAAIKLSPDEDVALGLVIGEGIETALAALQLGFGPVWAVGSAGAIRTFPVLPVIETLTILVETDDGGVNMRAVDECAERWEAAGREAWTATPPTAGDMADIVKRMAA